jgi:hypothetical protein
MVETNCSFQISIPPGNIDIWDIGLVFPMQLQFFWVSPSRDKTSYNDRNQKVILVITFGVDIQYQI